MRDPSVKGTIFLNVVEELHQALDTGRVTGDVLLRELKPEELDLFECEIGISTWYPADTYCKMLRILAESADGSVKDFLLEGGRRSAQRVIDLGLYGQLDDRTDGNWESRVGRILVTLSGAFFSFGKWEWLGLDALENDFKVGISEAEPFSEELILRTQGFIEELARRAADGNVIVTHTRRDGGSYLLYSTRRVG